MFQKILIANRGEIACRVAATARRLGIQTVAVFSEADATARHVAACDEALSIGPAAARDSYLRADNILAAARQSGAQAIHPGYGFLSENAEFAQACQDAGVTFIGPPVQAIQAMGSKSAAKTLMEQAGVPLVPGYHGGNQDPAFLQQQADRIGYPVLLKPSAGGGGKGMRVVERSADFKASLDACRREAKNAFGDDTVLLEKYLVRPRHIEIQVFADTHGQCISLFERDCSLQRRYQKIIEEAPGPAITPERRAALGKAAVAAAKAVGYVGAGTVEFIVDQSGEFYFMEMNTRLQVEHAVTEMITGLDLVEWQLRIASGEPLPQMEPVMRGHAIEARIYAENPEKGFLPSTGTLHYLDTPQAVQFQVGEHDVPAAVRIDSGVREGDTITPYYDPMIAKLIVWGEGREQALARMRQALARFEVAGVATNIAFLQRLLALPEVEAGQYDTGLIERSQQALFPAAPPPSLPQLALATAALLLREQANTNDSSRQDPWNAANGWRSLGAARRLLRFRQAGHEQTGEAPFSPVELEYLREGWRIQTPNGNAELRIVHSLRQGKTCRLHLLVDNFPVQGTVVDEGGHWKLFSPDGPVTLAWKDPLAIAGAGEQHDTRLTAPMPGKVIALGATPGQTVRQGDVLVIMEAMKMEHAITAPSDGKVETLLYQIGEQVPDGAPLLVFQAA